MTEPPPSPSGSPWRPTDAAPALGAGDVHAWRFGLDVPPGRLDELERGLSPDERHRADRFRRPQLRCRFVAARGLLRALLADYLGRPPGSIRFAYGPQGKPSLVDGDGLEFNLSHSGGRGLLAVARAPVGIDLELARPNLDPLRIADRFFAPDECQALHDAPPPDRRRLFLTFWVRKEAFPKATGTGLSQALDRFAILDDPLLGRPRLSGEPSPGPGAVAVGPDRWVFHDLHPGDDAFAALAFEGPERLLSCWEPRRSPWTAFAP